MPAAPFAGAGPAPSRSVRGERGGPSVARRNLHEKRLYLGKDRASILRQQRLLHSLGYNLTPDGIRGQITNSAWDAYKKGMQSNAWNRFIKKRFGRADAKLTQSSGGGDAAQADPLAVAGPAYTAPAAAPGGGVAPQFPTLAQLGINPKMMRGPGGYDVEKYAQALVSAEYDPMLAEERAARDAAQKQMGLAQSSIKDWYGQLVGEAQQMAGKNNAAAQEIMGGYNKGVQGAVEALGGGAAAGDAAAWGSIGASHLGGLGQIQTSFLTQLPPAYAAQGVDALRSQMAKDNAQIEAMNRRISDLTKARGSSYTKAIMEGLDKSQRDRIAEINAQAELAMLPLEYAGKIQGLQLNANEDARATAAANAAQGRAGLDYDLDRLRLAAGLAELNQGEEPAIPAWGDLDPSKLQGLRNELLSTVVSKQNPSALAVNPMRVYNAWGDTLRGLSGGAWNPAGNANVRNWRNNMLRTFLPGWNAAHPNKRYGFRNGKLVFLPNKNQRR